jgi:pimeloyl-ACP methyl ester carboxylesterase
MQCAFPMSLHPARLLLELPPYSSGGGRKFMRVLFALGLLVAAPLAHAADVRIAEQDVSIAGVDPGVKIFVRSKMSSGTKATRDNVVLFVHGATFPSTPDFDLQFQDYSWADWMVRHGWIVYLFDIRNYGASSREPAMSEPAADHRPLSRSYLAVRDIASVVEHIRSKQHVDRVSIIGWSWGAMTAGYYASLYSDRIKRLVLYAPLYSFPGHTNLGAGTGFQNKRRPWEFNYQTMGAYRLATAASNQARWDGEIPVADKTQFRDQAVVDAFNTAALATDPTSATRSPPSLRAPNGVLEDSFLQATGRPLWSASSIYVPVLVIAGEFDTWSYPEDREGLMRDLTNAPSKRSVTIKNATHFVLFEKPRVEFFETIDGFLKE